MKAKDIEYQLDHMMDMLIKWAIVGISLVKESALSAISSVV